MSKSVIIISSPTLLYRRHASGPNSETPAIAELPDQWYPRQVEQRDGLGRPDIGPFEALTACEDRTKGFFVAFECPSDPLTQRKALKWQLTEWHP